MKKLVLLLILLVPLFGLNPAKSCNLSEVSLIGITPGPGANTTISFRLCMGYGITGSTKGADGATSGITFGWYTTVAAPAFSIISYTPTAISSPVGATSPPCTMPSFNLNNPPGPVFVGVDVGTFFTMPGSCTSRFLCVTSTANCGALPMVPHCITFSFVVNYVPDSMRVFGVEGAGNAVSGCYPNADMRIDFGGSLPIAVDDDYNELSDMNVWPNPVVDVLQVGFSYADHDQLSLSVRDMYGRRVHYSHFDALHGSKVIELNLAHLSAGTYFLEAESSKSRVTRKIVKL